MLQNLLLESLRPAVLTVEMERRCETKCTLVPPHHFKRQARFHIIYFFQTWLWCTYETKQDPMGLLGMGDFLFSPHDLRPAKGVQALHTP